MRSDAQKRAEAKYKHNHRSQIVLQYAKKGKEAIDNYCHSINVPVATWIKSLIRREMESAGCAETPESARDAHEL